LIDELLTAHDVKKALRCSLPHVYNLADRGQIPCIRFPSPSKGKPRDMVRFKIEDVRQFIEAHYVSLRVTR
jgi:predicted DNA-binding transcriptional regulator AlpA